jgi:hypothetical protein
MFKKSLKIYRKKNNLSKSNNDISRLQRSLGNQGFQKFLKNNNIQAKLNISQPNDKYEKEADEMADKVVKMSKSQIQQQNEEKEKFFQPKESEEGLQLDNTFVSQLSSAKSEGESMNHQERAYFEPRFGIDFSDVYIHRGSKTQQLTKSINAQAFTQGNHIYFAQGKYNIQSNKGKHLIAHELTHTIQQKGISKNRSKIFRKEEKEKPKDKALKVAGKAAVKTFLKTPLGKNFKLKLKKIVKTPTGITLAGISGVSALSYMFAKNMDVPQSLIGLVPKFAKIDLNKNISISFQPIYKGKFRNRPKEFGGIINLTIINW